jgi:hypothetical protein
MDETRLQNDIYLNAQAEMFRQQEIKRKKEEEAAAKKQAAEAAEKAAEKAAADARAAIPYDEESVRRKYQPCSYIVDHYRGTTMHAYYLDRNYCIRDINDPPRVPKPQPKTSKKRKWQEVIVRHDSPFGDTSQLCKDEAELQWVYM